MGKYQGYDKYKDSGVEWLGEIPEHWEVKRLKRFAKICNGCDHKDVWDENGEYPIIGSGGIFGKANHYLYNKPSVLLGRKGTIDKPQFINVPFWSVDTAYYTDIFFITNPKFFYYLCLTIDFDSYKYGSAVPSMTQEKLNQILFAAPPLDEQEKIARFLDYKTKQIDKLIAKKETLIEKLDEKRTSLISHAVTKGLDVNVPMKDSGIEWLGEIPQHWEVKHLKNVASITRGAILRPVNDPSYFDENGEWLYLNISDVTKCEKFLYTAELKLSDIGSRKSARVLENNLILTASATIGIPIINKVKVCIHDGFIAFKEIKTNLFFLYYILLNKSIYSAMGKTNTQKNIYLDEVKIVKIGFPPLEEQQKIAEYLDQKTAEIEEQKTKIQQAIDLLKEYRTALITNAVTGKIDVSQVDIP
jgi:type I restriction enzyme S subunit